MSLFRVGAARVFRDRGLGDLMRRCLVLLASACAVFAAFALPAGAKPLPPPQGQLSFCSGGNPCDQRILITGTGGDLHYQLVNKCDGPTFCYNELDLTGSFDRVVIDRANQCTNGAACTIVVNVGGFPSDGVAPASFNSLQFRDGAFRSPFGLSGPITFIDHCDATSICTKSPPSPPPTKPVDDGGVCLTNQASAGPCLISGTSTGTGGDLHMALGNKCSVQVSCAEDFTLTGSFNNVVIDRANDCSNHATCAITVHIDAEINSLRIKDAPFRSGGIMILDHCDATAVCTKSP
jgi:hypothetical protein